MKPISSVLSVTLALSGLSLTGCSANTINGMVVRGDSSFIQWVERGRAPSMGGGEPIGGVAISVVRDPMSPGRQMVGSCISQPDGTFTLSLDAFGAGWTDEDWLIVAERRGAGRAEYVGRLQGGQSLHILLAAGTDRGAGANELWKGSLGTSTGSDWKGAESGESLLEEVKRYR
jgi:hypothetical protein